MNSRELSQWVKVVSAKPDFILRESYITPTGFTLTTTLGLYAHSQPSTYINTFETEMSATTVTCQVKTLSPKLDCFALIFSTDIETVKNRHL